MYGNMGEGLVGFFFICLAAAAAVGGAVVWLAPKVWGWVKPWIHALTA
jgi:hypothetical protein